MITNLSIKTKPKNIVVRPVKASDHKPTDRYLISCKFIKIGGIEIY